MKFYTRAEIARMWRCDEDTVSAALLSGELRGAKHGRAWVVHEDDLLEHHRSKAARPKIIRRRRQLPELPRQV